MTRGAALLLSIGLAAAAFLYGGIWEYGDGFIFNRFNGQVIYVELPEAEEAVRLRVRRGTDHAVGRSVARRTARAQGAGGGGRERRVVAATAVSASSR